MMKFPSCQFHHFLTTEATHTVVTERYPRERTGGLDVSLEWERVESIGLSLESLAIFGGSGATGREVVSEALRRGLQVRVLEAALEHNRKGWLVLRGPCSLPYPGRTLQLS